LEGVELAVGWDSNKRDKTGILSRRKEEKQKKN